LRSLDEHLDEGEAMKVLYTTAATATGGRDGQTTSADGSLDLRIVPPPELGGPEGVEGTDPETLFAAGYASCFHSAVKLIAEHKKIEHGQSTVTAEVDFGPTGSGGFGMGVRLHVSLPGVDAETAERLVRRAHKHCPYSNATRGNVELALSVNGVLLDEPAPAPA
jgi:lipoyl-dependent peroxiredoxin